MNVSSVLPDFSVVRAFFCGVEAPFFTPQKKQINRGAARAASDVDRLNALGRNNLEEDEGSTRSAVAIADFQGSEQEIPVFGDFGHVFEVFDPQNAPRAEQPIRP
jgi:hypothetical protein